jgi:predicted nuclease with TOPRIM domain
MVSDVKLRIEAAIKRRDELNAQKERTLGRLEEAEKNLEALRVECRAKNVDPDGLDDTVSKLEKALVASVVNLESQIAIAEKAIKPYTQS